MRRTTALSWALGTSLAAGCAAGCAAQAAQNTPHGVLSAYASAVAARDYRAAYALMSEPYRDRVSEEQFEEGLTKRPEEAQALVTALGRRAGSAREHATVELADGRLVELERHDDTWQIASGFAELYGQATPREALQSFIRALDQRRWDALLKLMPDAARQGVDEKTLESSLEAQRETIERMLVLLRASQRAPIEEVGERATMPYGDQFAVRFVREADAWKIEDPE